MESEKNLVNVLLYFFLFMISQKLTLVWLCIAPFIIVAVLFLVNALKTGIILERKHGKKQEVQTKKYNITVTSFANFEYETRRFNEKVELVY